MSTLVICSVCDRPIHGIIQVKRTKKLGNKVLSETIEKTSDDKISFTVCLSCNKE